MSSRFMLLLVCMSISRTCLLSVLRLRSCYLFELGLISLALDLVMVVTPYQHSVLTPLTTSAFLGWWRKAEAELPLFSPALLSQGNGGREEHKRRILSLAVTLFLLVGPSLYSGGKKEGELMFLSPAELSLAMEGGEAWTHTPFSCTAILGRCRKRGVWTVSLVAYTPHALFYCSAIPRIQYHPRHTNYQSQNLF